MPRPDDDHDDRPQQAKPSGGVALLGLSWGGGLVRLFLAGVGTVEDSAQKMAAERKVQAVKVQAVEVKPQRVVQRSVTRVR